jgi:hypothetical protein
LHFKTCSDQTQTNLYALSRLGLDFEFFGLQISNDFCASSVCKGEESDGWMCSAVSNKEQTETDQSRVIRQSPAGKPTMQENSSSSVVAKECQ